jgi:uncharacterized protein DUF3379
MNCQEFRKLIGAQPDATSPEAAAHAAQCPACSRYREQMQSMDRLLRQALEVDVSRPAPARPQLWRRPVWNLAASMVLTISIVAAAWLFTPRGSLANEVAAHVYHEEYAMVRTTGTVEADRLETVLDEVGLRLKPGTLHVSYARNCWFRGKIVPHLVVQTGRGPVTVLLMTSEAARSGLQQFTAQGLTGVVVPAPRGVVIVVGEDFPAEELAVSVLRAFEYEPTGRWLG